MCLWYSRHGHVASSLAEQGTGYRASLIAVKIELALDHGPTKRRIRCREDAKALLR
jgi:hypothetical protein